MQTLCHNIVSEADEETSSNDVKCTLIEKAMFWGDFCAVAEDDDIQRHPQH